MEYVKNDRPDAILLDLPPKHKANIGIRYRMADNMLITSDLRMVGQRKSEAGYTLSGYTTCDVGIEYSFPKNIKVMLYGNNIFGESYQEIYGYPMPDQTVGVNIILSFL